MSEPLLLPLVDFAVVGVLGVVDSFEDESFDELVSLEPASLEVDSFELDSLESPSFEVLDSFEPESFDPFGPALAAELEARESVLYQPLPLNTIPTG